MPHSSWWMVDYCGHQWLPLITFYGRDSEYKDLMSCSATLLGRFAAEFDRLWFQMWKKWCDDRCLYLSGVVDCFIIVAPALYAHKIFWTSIVHKIIGNWSAFIYSSQNLTHSIYFSILEKLCWLYTLKINIHSFIWIFRFCHLLSGSSYIIVRFILLDIKVETDNIIL